MNHTDIQNRSEPRNEPVNPLIPPAEVAKEMTEELLQVVIAFMNQHHISVDKAHHLLMETDIDNLNDPENHDLLKEILAYFLKLNPEYNGSNAIIRETYMHLRLKMLRLANPKKTTNNNPPREDGKESGHPNALHTIVETIRHFVSTAKND